MFNGKLTVTYPSGHKSTIQIHALNLQTAKNSLLSHAYHNDELPISVERHIPQEQHHGHTH